MQTLDAQHVPADHLDRLDAMASDLPEGSELGAALGEIVRTVRAGTGVVVAPEDGHVTPSAVGRLLGMSRTHLYKIMDSGDLPFVRVGRDRRIAITDLLEFRGRREQARKSLAERFAHAGVARAALVEEFVGDEGGA